MAQRKTNRAASVAKEVPARVTLDVTSRESAKGLTAKSIAKSVKTDLRLLKKFSFSS
jgi:hypothetical protein